MTFLHYSPSEVAKVHYPYGLNNCRTHPFFLSRSSSTSDRPSVALSQHSIYLLVCAARSIVCHSSPCLPVEVKGFFLQMLNGWPPGRPNSIAALPTVNDQKMAISFTMNWCEFKSNLCPLTPRTFGRCCHLFLLFTDAGPRTTATFYLVGVVPAGLPQGQGTGVCLLKGFACRGGGGHFFCPQPRVLREIWP
jgi:hypothetical protein